LNLVAFSFQVSNIIFDLIFFQLEKKTIFGCIVFQSSNFSPPLPLLYSDIADLISFEG